MNKGARLYGVVPVPFNADAGGGVRARTVAHHRAMSSHAIDTGEEHLVMGDAVLRKIEAFGFIGELMDGKLALVEHLFPGEAQNLEKMLSECGLGVRQ